MENIISRFHHWSGKYSTKSEGTLWLYFSNCFWTVWQHSETVWWNGYFWFCVDFVVVVCYTFEYCSCLLLFVAVSSAALLFIDLLFCGIVLLLSGDCCIKWIRQWNSLDYVIDFDIFVAIAIVHDFLCADQCWILSAPQAMTPNTIVSSVIALISNKTETQWYELRLQTVININM